MISYLCIFILKKSSMTIKIPRSRISVYIALLLLFAAMLLKYFGAPNAIFWTLFGMAILLKVLFLITILSSKGFKMTIGMYLILIGVLIILVSILLKWFPNLFVLQRILFFLAITLKVSGLILIVLKIGLKK